MNIISAQKFLTSYFPFFSIAGGNQRQGETKREEDDGEQLKMFIQVVYNLPLLND